MFVFVVYRSGTSPAEISIQWEDRAPNHGTARELHATEWQLANQLRQILATRSNPCWTNNSPNNHTEDDDVPAAIQENVSVSTSCTDEIEPELVLVNYATGNHAVSASVAKRTNNVEIFKR